MPNQTSNHRLFQPTQVGQMDLKHRIVLAPLTRLRANDNHIPTLPLMKEYYTQRASTPGTLLISEGVAIAPGTVGDRNIPGVYNSEQLHAWKEIVEAVHQQKSYIFAQIWAQGRQSNPDVLKSEHPPFDVIAPSPIPYNTTDAPIPRELTTTEIHKYIQDYATAASRVVNESNFDGVEIHAANGYLIDQFIQDVSNQRQDEYGGSVERRSRFGLEVVRAIVDALGGAEEKVGIRLSPWNLWAGMGMDDPIPQFTHFVTSLKNRFPNLAYIHVVEPRIIGADDLDPNSQKPHSSNDFLRDIWYPKTFISAGGYDREDAIRQAESDEGQLIAFGRKFIANPDLPVRLEKDIPLTPYNRDTFYSGGKNGYVDYPFASETKYRELLN